MGTNLHVLDLPVLKGLYNLFNTIQLKYRSLSKIFTSIKRQGLIFWVVPFNQRFTLINIPLVNVCVCTPLLSEGTSLE